MDSSSSTNSSSSTSDGFFLPEVLYDEADHLDSIYSDESSISTPNKQIYRLEKDEQDHEDTIERESDETLLRDRLRNEDTLQEGSDINRLQKDEQDHADTIERESDEDNQSISDVINEDYWIEEAFDSRLSFLCYNTALNTLLKLDKHRLPAAPSLPISTNKGSYVFLLNVNQSDMTYDCLSPWSTKKGKKIMPKWSKHVLNNQFQICTEEEVGEYLLRSVTARHPLYTFISRKIYILCSMNGTKLSDSPILFHYIFDEKCNLLANEKNQRVLPSTMLHVKEALKYRSISDAHKMLQTAHMNVSKDQVRNASRSEPTVKKRNNGPRLATDLAKVQALALKMKGIRTYTSTNDKGEFSLTITCVYKPALEHYLSDCPTKSSLQKHMSFCDSLEKMDEKTALTKIMNLLSSVNPSGSLPGLGSTMMMDTTYGLSHLYLTILQGSSMSFRNKNGKSASLMLGWSMHTHRSTNNHIKLGEAVATLAAEISPEKRVPCLVTDNEPSLRSVLQGELFAETQLLLCDVHLKANMKQKVTKQEFESTAQYLFGKKEKTATGVKLKLGLIGQLNRTSYDRKLDGLSAKLDDQEYTWLKKRKELIWKYHSLNSKLRGGLLLQYCSTNLLENRNGQLKLNIMKQLPGEELIQLLQKLHTEEMENLINSTIGKDSSVVLAPWMKNESITNEDWQRMQRKERLEHLAKFGLKLSLQPQKALNFPVPSHIFSHKTLLFAADEEVDKYVAEVEEMEVNRCGSKYFVNRRNTKEVFWVENGSDGYLNCHSTLCLKRKDKEYVPCSHILRCLNEEAEQTISKHMKNYESQWLEESSHSIMRKNVKLMDGNKRNRKFGYASKSNYVRSIQNISNLSETMVDSSPNQSSSSIELEAPDGILPSHLRVEQVPKGVYPVMEKKMKTVRVKKHPSDQRMKKKDDDKNKNGVLLVSMTETPHSLPSFRLSLPFDERLEQLLQYQKKQEEKIDIEDTEDGEIEDEHETEIEKEHRMRYEQMQEVRLRRKRRAEESNKENNII